MHEIIIKDETAAGEILREIKIGIAEDVITVKDLITHRVNHEVDEYNSKVSGLFTGLIQPSDAEKELNGFRVKKGAKIDAEKQVYTALKAFKRNGFFVLINNTQAEELEEEVLVDSLSNVVFIKLTPLVGG